MRKVIINGVAGALFGLLLAHMGYGIVTWEYWVGVSLAVVFIVNSLAD